MNSFVKKCSLAFVVALALSACAHPNYQEGPAPVGETKTGATCALKFNSQNLCAGYDWEKYPSESETGTFVVRFTNPTSGTLVDPGLSLKVILWMPSMGHGSRPVSITRLSSGVYRVDQVYFTMPGVWQIRFQLHQSNTIVEEQISTLEI